MSSVEQLINEFMVMDSDIGIIQGRLQCAQNELSEIMGKAQGTFGDQAEGQSIVATLSKTMRNVFYAESSMSMTRQEINDCIRQLQK